MPEHTPPPLWKQLLGAAGGMAVALIVYQGYMYAKPMVMAYLEPTEVTPVEAEVAVEPVLDTQAQQQKVIEHARRMTAQLLGDSSTGPSLEVPAEASSSSASAILQEAAPSSIASEAASFAASSIFSSVEASSAAHSSLALAATHGGAPNLPSSGLGLTLALMISGGSAGVAVVRRRFTV
jgi:hypothetical protein